MIIYRTERSLFHWEVGPSLSPFIVMLCFKQSLDVRVAGMDLCVYNYKNGSI